MKKEAIEIQKTESEISKAITQGKPQNLQILRNIS